jgi:hypothetical protein
MLRVVIVNVIMLSIVMLNVIMLNVVPPLYCIKMRCSIRTKLEKGLKNFSDDDANR